MPCATASGWMSDPNVGHRMYRCRFVMTKLWGGSGWRGADGGRPTTGRGPNADALTTSVVVNRPSSSATTRTMSHSPVAVRRIQHSGAASPPAPVLSCPSRRNAHNHRYVNPALCLSHECDTPGVESLLPNRAQAEFEAPDKANSPQSAEDVFVVPGLVDFERFYSDLVFELGEHARSGGTAIGAAVVAKRVALAHGVAAADRVPLPRMNRAELADAGRTGVSRARARGAVPRGR